MQVPKLQIFDFAVQPQSVLHVRHDESDVHIHSVSTRLVGTNRVGDIDLDDAFEMTLHVCLASEDDMYAPSTLLSLSVSVLGQVLVISFETIAAHLRFTGVSGLLAHAALWWGESTLMFNELPASLYMAMRSLCINWTA